MPDARRALVIIVDAARKDATEPLIASSRIPALAAAARPAMIAPSCWTVPSVASLLTGVFPWEHGLHWPLDTPPTAPLTIASFLEAAGRRMALVSANEMYGPPVIELRPGVAEFPLQRYSRPITGLRRTLGLLDYGGRVVLESVRRLVASDVPDVMVVHLNEAHHPYLPPVSGPLGRG
ncbi:MAG TPA: hypothetical protein QGH10_12755, partial [Armatimonadota bacterium]|nr:hypothetical protein [Armatimonadota bacterium]